MSWGYRLGMVLVSRSPNPLAPHQPPARCQGCGVPLGRQRQASHPPIRAPTTILPHTDGLDLIQRVRHVFLLLLTGDLIKGGMGLCELTVENENRAQLIA